MEEIKILGITFYRCYRVSKEKLLIDFSSLKSVNYIGLYAITECPRLHLNNYTINETQDWDLLVRGTIYFSLISLLKKGCIEVYKIDYNTSVLFLTYSTNEYTVKVLKTQENLEPFDILILKSIDRIIRGNLKEPTIKNTIGGIMNILLKGSFTHSRASKEMIKENLLRYSAALGWFDLKVETEHFGLTKQYLPKVDEGIFKNLIQSHSVFKKELHDVESRNYELKKFKRQVLEDIDTEIARKTDTGD